MAENCFRRNLKICFENKHDPSSLHSRAILGDPRNGRAKREHRTVFRSNLIDIDLTRMSFSAKYQKYRCLSVNEIRSTFIVAVLIVDVSVFNECKQRRISLSFICRLVPKSIDFNPKPIEESNDDEAGRSWAYSEESASIGNRIWFGCYTLLHKALHGIVYNRPE